MKRIALCFSGHIRNFCFDNIHENFIETLLDNDCVFDCFASFWDRIGYRQQNWTGKINPCFALEILQPKGFLIERFDREHFINKYNTNKWQEYSQLSNNTTCGDSVSMWYKIQTCLDMVEKYQQRYGFEYDAIVRIRPDVIFDNKFEKEVLDDVFNNDVIYIPKWHGKWQEISGTITDYFGIGNYKVMKQYMSVFNNIDNLIASNMYPHTGEGFLWGQIQGLDIKRLSGGFSVQRADHIEKVVE